MKPPDVARRELVLQWLDKAAVDFDAAEQPRRPPDSTMSTWVPANA
jgi:hypothetical protein